MAVDKVGTSGSVRMGLNLGGILGGILGLFYHLWIIFYLLGTFSPRLFTYVSFSDDNFESTFENEVTTSNPVKAEDLIYNALGGWLLQDTGATLEAWLPA